VAFLLHGNVNLPWVKQHSSSSACKYPVEGQGTKNSKITSRCEAR